MRFTRAAAGAALSLIFLLAPVVDAIGGNVNKQLLKNKQAQRARERLTGHFSFPMHGGKPSGIADEVYQVKQFAIETPMDHSPEKTTNETFMNRYWVYDRYYKAGGPIFLYHGAESNMSDYASWWLSESFLTDILQQFGGMGIVFEHRYYGGSSPYMVTVDMPAANLQYLTTAQALADVDYFANRFKSEKYAEIDKSPKKVPWIFLGISYGGNLASYAREKYPETFFAAYSSSAPVQAEVDIGAYFDRVYRGILELDPACARNMHSAIVYIDEQLSNSTETNTAIKQLFLGPGGEANSDGDFADTLAIQFWDFQNSGMDDESSPDDTQTLKGVCAHLNTDIANSTSPVEGWETTKGSKWIATRWASYPPLIDWIYAYKGANCGGYAANPNFSYTCKLGRILDDGDSIAWRWQYCTEYGYFQTGNEGPYQLVSKYSDVKYWQELCRKQFANANATDFLPELPTVNVTNTLYGGWSRPQSRTLYVINDMDPWSVLGFYSNDTDAPLYQVSNNVPGCEDTFSGNRIFGYLLENSYHGQDGLGDRLGNDTGKPATDLFKKALAAWLPCFGKDTAWKPQVINTTTHSSDMRTRVPNARVPNATPMTMKEGKNMTTSAPTASTTAAQAPIKVTGTTTTVPGTTTTVPGTTTTVPRTNTSGLTAIPSSTARMANPHQGIVLIMPPASNDTIRDLEKALGNRRPSSTLNMAVFSKVSIPTEPPTNIKERKPVLSTRRMVRRGRKELRSWWLS